VIDLQVALIWVAVLVMFLAILHTCARAKANALAGRRSMEGNPAHVADEARRLAA